MEKLEKERAKTREMLDKIITSTFTRFADDDTENFLKEIGKSGEENESKAIRDAKFSLICAITKDLVVANQRLELLIRNLKLLVGEQL